MPDDHDLLRAWADGHAAAGEAFYERHAERITRFFTRKVAPDEAADLVQRTFLAALSAARSGHRIRHGSGWLFAIARNQLYDLLRSRRRSFEPLRTSLADIRTRPSTALAAHEAQRALLVALEQLPVDDQLALELFYWEDLSMREVADALGISRSAAISRVHRARDRIRQLAAIDRGDPRLPRHTDLEQT